MPSCRESTRLMSEWGACADSGERVGLHPHLLMCAGCRNLGHSDFLCGAAQADACRQLPTMKPRIPTARP